MIELVALDADDTLWHNEPLYTNTREQFRQLLAKYEPSGVLEDRLYEVELRNLRHFGYGVKGFVLSLIESAIEMTGGRVETADVSRIIEWGREMLVSPVELLEGVREVAEELAADFPLILVTKGDLLHQETKLASSGLGHLFKGLEVVSEKDERIYRNLIARHGIRPDRFVMVGNSLRSDVLPALEAGAQAVYIPYEMSWVHERISPEAMATTMRNVRCHQIAQFRELPILLHRLETSSGAV
jgi:putative hydrolase of the HAD superfamily